MINFSTKIDGPPGTVIDYLVLPKKLFNNINIIDKMAQLTVKQFDS